MKTSAFIRRTPAALAIAAIGLGVANPALAFKFDLDNGISGSLDSTLSFGIQRRMQSSDRSIIGNDSGGNVPTTGQLGEKVNGAGNGATSNPDFNYTNIDDGNLNYKKGDIVSAVLKGTHELAIGERGNWAALGRVTWSSDFAAIHTDRTPLDEEAKKALRQDVTLLDLWVSKDFNWAGNSAKLKFGNQVINWGEDIFIFGGINSIHAFDVRKAHIPGTQVKEILLPAPMISLNTAVAPGLSMEGYYQFAWNSFKLDPAGSYWSSADFLGKGGKRGAFFPSSVLGLPTGTVGDYDPTRGAHAGCAQHGQWRARGDSHRASEAEQEWPVRSQYALQASGWRYRICRLLHPLPRQAAICRLQGEWRRQRAWANGCRAVWSGSGSVRFVDEHQAG